MGFTRSFWGQLTVSCHTGARAAALYPRTRIKGKFRLVAQKPAGAGFCLQAKLDGDYAPHTRIWHILTNVQTSSY